MHESTIHICTGKETRETGTGTYKYTSWWHVIQETGIRDKRVQGTCDTSIERIASASVLVKEKQLSVKNICCDGIVTHSGVPHTIGQPSPQDTGTWAHSVETEHPQIIPLQSVPCTSGGPHCSVPCTHSWPSVSVLAVGAGYQ